MYDCIDQCFSCHETLAAFVCTGTLLLTMQPHCPCLVSAVDYRNISGPVHLRITTAVPTMLNSSSGSFLPVEQYSMTNAAFLERESAEPPCQETPNGIQRHWLHRVKSKHCYPDQACS